APPRRGRGALEPRPWIEPLPPPTAASWRTLRPEPAQSLQDYRALQPNVPAPGRDRIVLQPLGHFPFDVIAHDELVMLVRAPELTLVAEVVEAAFGLPTTVLPPAALPETGLRWRSHDGQRQLDAISLIDHVAPQLPPDAYAMLSLVTADVFAWPEQRYAFGWSTYVERLGVCSFARLDPSAHGGPAPVQLERTLAHRGLRIVAHELAHTFGLAHCQAGRCLLNGVADLVELDALPLRLCAACRDKLRDGIGLDLRGRDDAVAAVLRRRGLAEVAT
ncbi:MAG: archaemetzincin, partial [Nannocystaceae bacterium]|nr:archaemetzincin [Nannocystaceae bacterium]